MPHSVRRLVAAYRPIAIFWLWGLVLQTSSRLLLMMLYRDRVVAVDGAATVLLQGVRFDVIQLTALSLLPALLAPWLARWQWWSPLLRAYLIAALLVAVFMEAATPAFVAEYDLRPNMLFVEYLVYPREVASMLWEGYLLELVTGVAVVLVVCWLFARRLSANVTVIGQEPVKLPMAAACTVLVLLLGVIGVRSSFGHRPANPSMAAFSPDLLVNDLILPSAYNVAYAVYNAGRHESGMRAYGRMPWLDVIHEVRKDMALAEQDFISDEVPTLHRSPWVRAGDPPLNLVIILEESLGAEFVGRLGGVGVTPELDRLAAQGIWFDNLYATGTRSVRGVEAVVTGFTPTPARSVVKLPRSQSNFFTLAELLGRQGYDTSFIYGGEAHFDNMRQFFVGNGFQRIIEQKDFDAPVFEGTWGVSDEDLFDRAHREFERRAQDGPFFSLVFSSSNHSPFEFPEGRIELHEEPAATVNNAVKYADYALGRFFRRARQSSYWENTLFLVVADHNSRVRGANLVPIEYFHVPGVILGGPVKPQVYHRLASQIDLPPTMLGLMGIQAPRPTVGHDLFRPDVASIPGRAIMQYNQSQAFMQGDKVVILSPDQPASQFVYQRASGLRPSREPDEALVRKALAYSIWGIEAYRQGLYRLP
jgi:phosphoglycerol transferase MdoB-like AlkP superfamily enzyme